MKKIRNEEDPETKLKRSEEGGEDEGKYLFENISWEHESFGSCGPTQEEASLRGNPKRSDLGEYLGERTKLWNRDTDLGWSLKKKGKRWGSVRNGQHCNRESLKSTLAGQQRCRFSPAKRPRIQLKSMQNLFAEHGRRVWIKKWKLEPRKLGNDGKWWIKFWRFERGWWYECCVATTDQVSELESDGWFYQGQRMDSGIKTIGSKRIFVAVDIRIIGIIIWEKCWEYDFPWVLLLFICQVEV